MGARPGAAHYQLKHMWRTPACVQYTRQLHMCGLPPQSCHGPLTEIAEEPALLHAGCGDAHAEGGRMQDPPTILSALAHAVLPAAMF